VTTWQPGQPVPPGYCIEIAHDGSERLTESWPDSPCSEPVEEDDAWQEGDAHRAAQARTAP
jgi:hypothetical protein